MQKLESRIITGTIWKEMVRFFAPIMFGTLLQQVYNIADTIIVSRYVGKLAVAATGGSDLSIIWLLVNAFVSLSSGAGVVISQHYGAGDVDRVKKAVHTAICLALISGSIVTALGMLGGPTLLRLLGTKEELMAYSLDYLEYYFMGMIPALIYNMGSGILRAVGDSKKPLYFLAVSVIANIGLDILFVKYLQMEVKGAAIATTLCQVISAILVLVELCRTKNVYKLEPKALKIHGFEMKAMLMIGIPATIQSISYNICNILIQAAINMLSTDTVAAWSVFWKLDGIYWPISNAMGIAVMTFVGQNYGAGKRDRIRESIRTGIKLHLAFTVLYTAVLILGREFWMSCFIEDANVIRIGMEIICILGPAYLTFCLTEVFSSAMRGAGKAVHASVITIFCICVIRVIFLYTVVFRNPSNLVISACYPISWFASSVGFVIYYLKTKWVDKLPIADE